jgi:hypothetical protein
MGRTVGSGKRRERVVPLVTECLGVRMAEVAPRPGESGRRGTLVWDDYPGVTVHFTSQRPGTPAQRDVVRFTFPDGTVQDVGLVRQQLDRDGYRDLFETDDGRRCAKLYLYEFYRFRTRQEIGAGYACQRLRPGTRAERRAFRESLRADAIMRRLESIGGRVNKPIGMRTEVWRRLVARLNAISPLRTG